EDHRVAPDAVRRGVDDAEPCRTGHGRVEGVAAGQQNLLGGARRLGLHRRGGLRASTDHRARHVDADLVLRILGDEDGRPARLRATRYGEVSPELRRYHAERRRKGLRYAEREDEKKAGHDDITRTHLPSQSSVASAFSRTQVRLKADATYGSRHVLRVYRRRQNLVCRKREELLQLGGGGDLLEQLPRLRKMSTVEPRGADFAAHAIVLLLDALLHERLRHRPAVIERRAVLE